MRDACMGQHRAVGPASAEIIGVICGPLPEAAGRRAGELLNCGGQDLRLAHEFGPGVQGRVSERGVAEHRDELLARGAPACDQSVGLTER